MIKRLFILIFFLAVTGCVKETYDMNKLSEKAHLSPTWGISAVRGDISISDIIEPSDTVIFDEDNFIRIVFKEDSVIDFRMEDYYDLNDMVSFSEAYQIGEMNLSSFGGTISYSLDKISQRFNPVLRAQFVALDGTTANFPSFPATILQETAYSPFSNFGYATFDKGIIDISVKNNLPAPVSGLSVRLYNTTGHTPIGNQATISVINPGQTGIASINIANATVSNSITAAITLSGSPGTSVPVLIDLDGSNIEAKVTARDLWVKSGRIVVPTQNISALGDDGVDTVTFDPGSGIEIALIKMKAGNISYTIQSRTRLSSSVSLTLPTALQNGIPLTESVSVNANTIFSGNFPVDNSLFDLSTITTQPYNMIPVDHTIIVSSNGQMVDFSSSDEVQIDLRFLNPDFDYVKGYFGQETETFGPETLDPDIEDIINKISGDFLFSNPSITLNYANSFALPVEIDLQAVGYKGSETVDLGLEPFTLSYPAAPEERDKTGNFTIDKTNSSLPALISIPPVRVTYSGSAKMNPQGNTGSRDNYIFGDSRFLGSFEVEIPMDIRMTNLQFTDTVDNFLQMDDNGGDNPVKPDDFEFMRINFTAENGFPVGVSVNVILYDSATHLNKSTIEAEDILKPAAVDNNGRVTTPAESSASIEITREFWNSVDLADKIIFRFAMSTTGNGSKEVKIYSDYKINFTASIVLKPDIKFKLD